MAPQRLSRIILLVVASLSAASAFQNSAVAFSAKGSIPAFDAQTTRPHARTRSTEIYGSRVHSFSSPTSLPRVRRQGQSSTLTQLQYSDDSSSSSTTPLESSWWKKMFAASSIDRQDTSTGSSDTDNKEQENVDAYLEFLDRRYRRLHCDDKEEEKVQAKQQDSPDSENAKTFSAMEWLTKGGNGNSNSLATTRQQQEDALYVLGVAGLASQKLLQKHHLPTSTATTIDKVVELKEQIDDAIEVGDANVSVSLKTKANSLVLNTVLLPIIRSIYILQRMKQLVLQMAKQQVTALATRVANGVFSTFAQGPISVLSAILGVGGGKRNIFRTVAIGYATVLFFRPLMRAIFAGGLALDPLIQ